MFYRLNQTSLYKNYTPQFVLKHLYDAIYPLSPWEEVVKKMFGEAELKQLLLQSVHTLSFFWVTLRKR